MNTYNENTYDTLVKPDNHMPLSIIGTILGICSPCCIGIVIGIVAIVFSAQVNSKFIANDYDGATSSAKSARILAFIAIGLGIIGIIITIIQIYMMGGISGMMEHIQQILEQYQ